MAAEGTMGNSGNNPTKCLISSYFLTINCICPSIQNILILFLSKSLKTIKSIETIIGCNHESYPGTGFSLPCIYTRYLLNHHASVKEYVTLDGYQWNVSLPHHNSS